MLVYVVKDSFKGHLRGVYVNAHQAHERLIQLGFGTISAVQLNVEV